MAVVSAVALTGGLAAMAEAPAAAGVGSAIADGAAAESAGALASVDAMAEVPMVAAAQEPFIMGEASVQALRAAATSGGAGVGGGGSRFIFHGTTGSAAQSILSPSGVQAMSTNTAPFPAGSFFTHEGGELAHVAASHWSARSAALYGSPGAVLRGEVPAEVMRSLEQQGLVRTGPVPGLPFFPHQTVFLPEALPSSR
jgi:hypothetical protein